MQNFGNHFLNKYTFATAIFAIFLLVGENNFINFWTKNTRLSQQKSLIRTYQKEIEYCKYYIPNQINNGERLEKIAREKYFMKKSKEDIFLIERN